MPHSASRADAWVVATIRKGDLDATKRSVQDSLGDMDGGGGLVTAAVVYVITASVGWAVVGLLVSGFAPVLVRPSSRSADEGRARDSAESESIVATATP